MSTKSVINLTIAAMIIMLMIGCSMMGASDANGNHFWGLFPKELAPILGNGWGSGRQTTATPTIPSGNGSATNPKPSATPTSNEPPAWFPWLDFNHFTPPPPTLDELNSRRLNGLMWAGIGMIVLGIGTYILRAYVPLVSGTAGTYLLVAGAATVVASFVLADIPPWMWWIVIAMATLGLILHLQGFSLNKKAANTTTTTATSTTTIVPPPPPPSVVTSPPIVSASSVTQTGATK